MTPETCPPMHLWRVWPAFGASFVTAAHCIHQHIPSGDWSLHREGEAGQIVAVMQSCGTVIVDVTAMQKDPC